MDEEKPSVTRLLKDWKAGSAPPERLATAVYDELRKLASYEMRKESKAHTLQPTALVHEAWMRLAATDVSWSDRAHFFALAARTMRRVLVDHARTKGAAKRGKGTIFVEIVDDIATPAPASRDILELDAVLTALGEKDPRMAQIVELHYFAGLEYEELATALSISAATVGRELRLAKAWMHRELTRPQPEGPGESEGR